jgi:ABC-type phosphate/phosphonate transport system substrate-binding protein
MYDLLEVRGHLDRLWSRLAATMRELELADVPEPLAHPESEFDAHWSSGDLFFTQICGIEVVKRFRGRYRVLATPRFAARGCAGHSYRSLVTVRGDAPFARLEDLRGARIVVNSHFSHSGTTALVPLIAPISRDGSFFGALTVSGGHVASLARLQRGEADVAAIDCITWALLERDRPGALAGLRVIAETPLAPAPPFVAPSHHGDEVLARLRQALARVFAEPGLSGARRALLLDGLEPTDDASYRPHLEFLEAGACEGYDELSQAYRAPVAVPLARQGAG